MRRKGKLFSSKMTFLSTFVVIASDIKSERRSGVAHSSQRDFAMDGPHNIKGAMIFFGQFSEYSTKV